jgi:hypothetical protein
MFAIALGIGYIAVAGADEQAQHACAVAGRTLPYWLHANCS